MTMLYMLKFSLTIIDNYLSIDVLL